MAGGPEFVDDDRVADAEDDVLETQAPEPAWVSRMLAPARRHPSARRVAVTVATAAALLAAAATVLPHGSPVSGHGSVAEASDPPVRALTTGQAAIANVRGLVATPGALTDYVRQTSPAGACPTVAVGSAPTHRIAQAVHAALPDFVVTEVASTLDQFTGLCSVRLRAHDAQHVTLAVIISAPPSHAQTVAPGGYTRLVVGTDSGPGADSTSYVLARTVQQWSVLIGVVGRPDLLLPPLTLVLQRLAQLDTLTW